jgi:hypothetical protein
VGGTISEATGGKFANGARSSAIGQAFNGNSLIQKEVDYNGQTHRNIKVRYELNKLRAGLDVEGYSEVDVTVTGGESYYDPENKQVVSMSTGDVINNRGKNSAHNLQKGARDVDLRATDSSVISDEKFKAIVNKYTDFSRAGNGYSDRHWHLGLPNYRKNYCPRLVCSR